MGGRRGERWCGIVNEPKRAEDPQCIGRLIGKVISVGRETVGIVEGLLALGVGEGGEEGAGWAGSGGLCVCAGCGWGSGAVSRVAAAA